MATPVSTALLAFLAIDSAEAEVPLSLEKIVFLTIYSILQRAGNHARIAHRAKINVFDVLRALLSMNFSPRELKVFLAWCRFQSQRRQQALSSQKLQQPQPDKFNQECEVKLEFAPIPPAPLTKIGPVAPAPSTLANIAGCQFYPPIPPAFTYKYTPVQIYAK